MNSKKLFLVYLIALTLPAFAQQADMSFIPYRKGNLWGFASPDKQVIIKPAYDEAGTFHVGYASVRKGAKYGYINEAGKLVIPYKFAEAKPFRYGYTDNLRTHHTDTVLFAGASATAGGIERCINTRGVIMSKCPAINENTDPENNKPILKDSDVTSFGTLMKSETFDKVTDGYGLPNTEDNYYVAVKNNIYGVINNKFEVIVPFEYTTIKKLVINNSIYLLAEKNGLKGIFRGNGTALINVENSRLDPVKAANNKEYLVIAKNGNTGIKDINLQDLVSPQYADIQYDNPGGFVLTTSNNMKGYYFLNNTLLEARYTDVKSAFRGNYVMIKTQAGKAGYVSNMGVEFFEE